MVYKLSSYIQRNCQKKWPTQLSPHMQMHERTEKVDVIVDLSYFGTLKSFVAQTIISIETPFSHTKSVMARP